MTTWSKAPE